MDTSQRLLSSFASLRSVYHPSHHRQKELTDSIVTHLVLAGNLPISLVEQSWFADFMKVVDAKYRLPSRYKVTNAISQKFQGKCAYLQSKLTDVKYVTLTLDMWSDRRMRSYMGITAHFMSPRMKLQSFLLDFAHFTGRHTGDNLADHCAKVIQRYHLSDKVIFLITDNAANMVSAFRDLSGMLDTETVDAAIETDDDSEPTSSAMDSTDDPAGGSVDLLADLSTTTEVDDDVADNLLQVEDSKSEQVLDYIGGIVQKRMSCCIHTLQLVVIDGLKAAKFMRNVQSKASRLATLLHTSGKFADKYFAVFKTTVPQTNNTR